MASLKIMNEVIVKYDRDNSRLRIVPAHVLWADKTNLLLTGKVNSKNCVNWLEENSCYVKSRPCH